MDAKEGEEEEINNVTNFNGKNLATGQGELGNGTFQTQNRLLAVRPNSMMLVSEENELNQSLHSSDALPPDSPGQFSNSSLPSKFGTPATSVAFKATPSLSSSGYGGSNQAISTVTLSSEDSVSILSSEDLLSATAESAGSSYLHVNPDAVTDLSQLAGNSSSRTLCSDQLRDIAPSMTSFSTVNAVETTKDEFLESLRSPECQSKDESMLHAADSEVTSATDTKEQVNDAPQVKTGTSSAEKVLPGNFQVKNVSDQTPAGLVIIIHKLPSSIFNS